MSAPIDPREINTLYATYEDAYEKAVGRIPFGISPAQMKGNAIYAVARAVLPEGYVAVPIELVRDALRFADHRSSEKCVHQHMNTLRSLIAESEATP